MATTVKLLAPDISCDHCARTITNELTSLDGIENIVVDVASKEISLDAADDAALSRALVLLDEIGYPAQKA